MQAQEESMQARSGPRLAALACAALVALASSPRAEAQVTCEEGVVAACVREGDYHIQQRRDFERAARLFERGCNAGDAASCGRLGVLYRIRPEHAAERARGAQLAVDACRRGDAPACEHVVRAFMAGDAEVRGQREIRPALDARCAAGDDAACVARAIALDEGIGGRVDRRAAIEALRAPCGRRSVGACGRLATTLAATARSTADRRRAVEVADFGCQLGSADACGARVALARAEGGVDEGAIAALVDRACTAGHEPSCLELARALEGRDDRASRRRAGAIWSRACERGDADACGRLGLLTLRVDPASREADGLLLRGCEEASLVDACLAIGERLASRDPVAARAPLARACEAGRSAACARLGAIDPENAARWHRRACEGGVFASCVPAAEATPLREARTASRLLERGCDGNDGASCAALATRRSGASAAALRARACELGHVASCPPPPVTATAPATPVTAPEAATPEPICDAAHLEVCEASVHAGADPAALERARPHLRRACRARRASACHALGVALAAREGAADRREAATLLRSACELGAAAACAPAARAAASGRGRRARTEAIALAERGVQGGDTESAATLADLLAADPAADGSRVLGLYRDACEGGRVEACGGGLAFVGTRPELRAAHPEDVRVFDAAACASGDGEACEREAAAHAARGDAASLAAATSALDRACAAGRVAACGRLADRIAELAPDGRARVVSGLARGCEAGDAESCDRGARAALASGDSPEHHAESARLFAAACRAGRTASCAIAGDARMSAGGALATRAREAAALYREACSGAEAEGCPGLVSLCGRGQLEACGALVAACDGGTNAACEAAGVQREGTEP